MSVLMKNNNTNKNILFIKGAPDYLLAKATKTITKSGKIVNLD